MKKLGIIAGGGELPERLIHACHDQSRPVFVAAIEGEAEAERVAHAPHKFFLIGAAGKIISALKAEKVEEIVLAGRIKRPAFSALNLDMTGVKLMARVAKARMQGDDLLLKTIVTFLEEQGFSVVGADDVLGDLLIPAGPLGSITPQDDNARNDIALGMQIAKAIGELDIGQAVVVQQSIVIGVEALEGTDKLLERAAQYRLEGVGGVLVKMRKPTQEARVDLPTIGIQTLENAHKAGLRGIAVQAYGALVMNRQELAARADALGMFVVGVE